MKHIKKLVVIFVLIHMSAQGLFAQISPTSVQELMSYFKSNIRNLDPIEGVYDVNIEQWGENAYQKFSPETTNLTMLIYKNTNGEFKIFKIDHITIKKIGETSAYNFNILWEGSNVTVSKRFVLKESTLFEVKYSIPDRQLRYDMRRNYQAAFKVHFEYSFIKTYPTVDMYTSNIAEDEDAETHDEWTGTGFALNNGYVVSNYHVIENAKSIYIQGIKGNFTSKYNATVIATDRYNDLALLQITDNNFNGFGPIPYNVKTSVADVGEEVFVLGYPLISTMGDEIKLTTGVISSKTGFQGDVSLYQISAPIQPGNSGGPVFDNEGNLIGVVNAKHKGTENVSYAIKASYLKNLIESSISTSILPSNNQIAGLPLTGKVKNLKNYVFMITCSNTGSSSTYSADPSISTPIKTIENPTVSKTTAERAKIKSVKLAKDYTAIEITSNNQSGNSYYQWCNIDRNTYILVNGKRYTLTRTNGIKIAPEKTYFSYEGQNITFILYFPPISDTATSIDLIESVDSEWKFYGIKIR